jgi:hypothetical protein
MPGILRCLDERIAASDPVNQLHGLLCGDAITPHNVFGLGGDLTTTTHVQLEPCLSRTKNKKNIPDFIPGPWISIVFRPQP